MPEWMFQMPAILIPMFIVGSTMAGLLAFKVWFLILVLSEWNS